MDLLELCFNRVENFTGALTINAYKGRLLQMLQTVTSHSIFKTKQYSTIIKQNMKLVIT
jgi:hypothetical protein